MATFYEEMADTALELIKEFGQPLIIRDAQDGSYDPVTGNEVPGSTVDQQAQGMLLDYSTQDAGAMNAAGTLVQRGDKKILVAAAGLSSPPDLTSLLITADGQVWTAVNVRSTNPAGTPLVHEVHGRR